MILNENNILKVVKSLEKKAHEKATDILDFVCNDITKTTQRNFNQVVDDIPADDPYVFVTQTPTFYVGKTQLGRKIECKGNQVLFIEFGAGTHEQGKVNKSSGIEFASRPFGIYPLGYYSTANRTKEHWQQERMAHMSRGQDDYWFYSSQTGRESNNASQVKYNTKAGTFSMITIGIRPVRALYRAVGLSFKKLDRGLYGK